VAQKRKQISAKLEVADAQPPELGGETTGARGEGIIDITKLSDDEFNALPESTLKRLRGDLG
jgi:hypothetical protein